MDIERHKLAIKGRITTSSPIPLEEELIDAYLNILKFKNVRKKQFITQPGFPVREQNYVVQGAFRAFFMDREGREQTIQFAIEDWYITDVRSYLTGEEATLFIEALEDSIIAAIPKEGFEALCDQYPKWQKTYRLVAERGFAYAQKRMISNLQKSAEERYMEFHRDYKEIEQRVPRHALASYLNMTQEYLSKIRKKLMAS